LFKHFGTKTGLLVAVPGDAGTTVLGRLEEARVASGGDFTVFVDEAWELLADPLFGEMARMRSFALTRADDPDVRAAIDDNVAGFDRLIDDVLAAGQRSGTVRGDVLAADVRELILGLLLAAGFRHALNPGGGGNPSRLLSLLLTLIQPSPTRKRMHS
jgi:AcrR family transcriptional regulator